MKCPACGKQVAEGRNRKWDHIIGWVEYRVVGFHLGKKPCSGVGKK